MANQACYAVASDHKTIMRHDGARRIAHHLVTGLLVVLVSATPMRAAAQADESHDAQHQEHWREALNCGPNSLYILLKSQGWTGTLGDVRAQFPTETPGACSLADISCAANNLGRPMTAIRTSIDELRQNRQLPAIVHMDIRGRDVGHFAVLVDISESRITGRTVATLLDPIMTEVYEMPADEFMKNWSTYAVVPAGHFPIQRFFFGTLVLLALGLLVNQAAGLFRVRLPWKRVPPAPSSAAGAH